MAIHQSRRHGNRNSAERVFYEVKRRTSSFSIRTAMLKREQQSRGLKPSESGGTDAKVNTMSLSAVTVNMLSTTCVTRAPISWPNHDYPPT